MLSLASEGESLTGTCTSGTTVNRGCLTRRTAPPTESLGFHTAEMLNLNTSIHFNSYNPLQSCRCIYS
jgi:hypothetical protein